MNLPLISSFVQSSIDAAMAEYVAPKSLTLDLREMMMGDDWKKDTQARGILAIYIKKCKGFKEGDVGFGPKKGSSDAYVTCSWAKFGRTASSTLIIEADQSPIWSEWVFMLVTLVELNAQERIRLQLWDSDKYTADDDLGRVEVNLRELMNSSETKNRMNDREDELMGMDTDDKMPGTIFWSVGYFSKKRITNEQLAEQTFDTKVRSLQDLKDVLSKEADRNLKEAKAHDERRELDQQKIHDYKAREDDFLCASPPASGFGSGVLSIQIHNITGLEIESLQKSKIQTEDEGEAEESDNLPSSYCPIILNHAQIYKTRVKPKNSKPFFNAGTERFIRDWKTCEVMIAVRDSREGEKDGLLGIVFLPLDKVFKHKIQSIDIYPLAGGMSFGRIRISMVFRSTEIELPLELRGWGYGTLEIKLPIKFTGKVREELKYAKTKLRSNISSAKTVSDNGQWTAKSGKSSVFLACRSRYAMSLQVEFRTSTMGVSSLPAFAVFWLKDIRDEEEKSITIDVWKGGKPNLKKAASCGDYKGMEQSEKPIGKIEMSLTFWRGLSGFHKSYSRKAKNSNIKDCMDALDVLNDEMVEDVEEDQSDYSDSSDESSHSTTSKKHTKPADLRQSAKDSSSSDSSSDGDQSTRNPIKKVKFKAKKVIDGQSDPTDGKRDVLSQAQDYKAHHKQLHRKHRGLMQWKATRKADWAMDGIKQVKGRLENVFHHEEKNQGVETEV